MTRYPTGDGPSTLNEKAGPDPGTRPVFRYESGWHLVLPAVLVALLQWVCWRYEPRDGGYTKAPYRPRKVRNAKTGRLEYRKAKANDPETWGPFAVARRFFEDSGGFLDGVGFEFSETDPFCGFDLDHCLDDDGTVKEWARPHLERLRGSYTEISPSGHGLKGVVRAKLPGTGTRKGGFGPDGKGAIELYDCGRFFTITGRVFGEAPGEIPDRSEAIAEIYAEIKPKGKAKGKAKEAPGKPAATSPAPDDPSDDAILERARKAKNGAAFDALFRGDTSAHHDDDSAADLAFCSHLAFWCGGDVDAIDRIFRRSGLNRDKWDRDDYRERTIAKALEGTAFYDPNRAHRNGKATAKPPRGSEAEDEAEAEGQVVDLWPRVDPLAFHGIAGEIAWRADPHNEGDPVATLIQLLVGFGNMIGRNAHFVVTATRHQLNLFAVLVGLTAVGRKGTSWDVARWILGVADPGWKEQCIKGGLISGEGLIHHVRDPVTERQRSKKGPGWDTVVKDPGVADKRLLVVETEFSSVLKVMARENNTLTGVMRQAWDGIDLGTMSKHNGARATNAHVSIIAHATKADLEKHLTAADTANGFANRFLWPAVRQSKSLPDGGELSQVDWTDISRRLGGAIAFARQASKMNRDLGASKIWHGVYENLSAGKPGLLGAILNRAVPQTMRLACLFALLDLSATVRAEHMIAALALWEYCEASARFIFGDSLGDPVAEKLLDALKSAPEGLTRTGIIKDVFQKHKESRAIIALLSKLLTLGLIHRRTDNATGGRPAERWYAGRSPNPAAN